MVFLVRVLRTGLGLASEAIQTAQDQRLSKNQTRAIDDSQKRVDQPTWMDRTVNDESLPSHQAGDYDGEEGKKNGLAVQPDSSVNEPADVSQDELAWQLDEMIESLKQPSTNDGLYPLPYDDASTYSYDETEDDEERKLKKREALAHDLAMRAGPPPDSLQPLSCSVIIPQRRPRNKDRGFVRAYAPALEDSGTSEEVFLQFLEYIDIVNHASAWIEVVYIAAQIISSLPFPAAMAVGMILSVVAGTARESQKRTRANTFLEMVNRDLFMPRGLFVMVMAFKPDDSDKQGPLGKATSSLKNTLFKKEKVDADQAAAKWSNPESNRSTVGTKLDNIRLQSGETNSELELPETASLIFPQLDQIAAGEYTEEQSKGIVEKFKCAGAWVTDYMDRRAMVFYVCCSSEGLDDVITNREGSKAPWNPMVIPPDQRKPMKSRFNDPNHPVNSGSMLALVTGGLVPLPSPGKLFAKRNENLGLNRLFGQPEDFQDGRLISSTRKHHIKKLFLKNVLYLTVVNLTTSEETEQHKAQFGVAMENSEDYDGA